MTLINTVNYGSALSKIVLTNKIRKACVGSEELLAHQLLTLANKNHGFSRMHTQVKECIKNDREKVVDILGEELVNEIVTFK